MSKMGKHETARHEGADWFRRLVETKGFEEAKKELEWRGAIGAPLQVEEAELNRFVHEVKQKCTMTICTMAVMVLLDEFDFKAPEVQRFITRFNSKTDAIADDIVSWPDMRQAIFEETGIDVDTNQILWDNTDETNRAWKEKEKHEGRIS